MQRLTDNARRARALIERENAPLPPDCARVPEADLSRVLGAYFELTAPAEVTIARGEQIVVTVRASASHAKPFGVL